MCNPMAALALGAGPALQFMGAQKAENARNRAINAETRRQGLYMDELNENLRHSLSQANVKGMEEGAAKAGAGLSRQSEKAGRASFSPETNPVSGSRTLNREVASQTGAAKRASDLKAKLNTKRIAYDQAGFDRDITLGRDAALSGNVRGFMRGSSAILPAELEAANRRGALMRLGGQLITQGGTMAAGGGFGNLFGGPSAASSVAPMTPGQYQFLKNARAI